MTRQPLNDDYPSTYVRLQQKCPVCEESLWPEPDSTVSMRIHPTEFGGLGFVFYHRNCVPEEDD